MSPEDMAALYARAFPDSRPWGADEISQMIDGPGGFSVMAPEGFALGRAIAGEAELLTIAVNPAHRREGLGRTLLTAFEAEASRRDAAKAFLEVAADNTAALGLYLAAGWTESGRRAGYYARPTGAVDALTMEKTLANGLAATD